jgi:hypothetical protein
MKWAMDGAGKSADDGPKRASAGIASERALERVFGDPVPGDELAIWASVPAAKRDKVIQRIVALDRHLAADGGIAAKQSAADAGLTLSRFYQMLRAWGERRSLASVGASASTTRTRQRMDSEVAGAVQAAVVKVVAESSGDSMAALIRRVSEVAGVKKAPNTLRPFVERELRRLAQRKLAGEEIFFDCVATSLRRSDGTGHVAFLVIDAGTGLIRGHAVGDASASAAGYAAAARNAQDVIFGTLPPSEIWADETRRSQIVPGGDASAIEGLVALARDEAGGIAPQIVRAGSYGRYVRAAVGLKIGPIRLLPARTGTDSPPADWSPAEGLDATDAQARLTLAVTAQNDEVVAALDGLGRNEPSDGIDRLLAAIARS